jgi:hypothetical protein
MTSHLGFRAGIYFPARLKEGGTSGAALLVLFELAGSLPP